MHSSLATLATCGLLLTRITSGVPAPPQDPTQGNKSSESAEASSATEITFSGGLMDASNDAASVSRKIINWDTPLIEGDCLFYDNIPHGPPVVPDTPEQFQDDPSIHKLATLAPDIPDYTLDFIDLPTAVDDIDNDLIGGLMLETYDPVACAILCGMDEKCKAFNVYALRFPAQYVDSFNCPNPPSLTAYNCALFSHRVEEAPTIGRIQWAEFVIAAAGSNVYNKIENDDDTDADKKDGDTQSQPAKRDCLGGPAITNGGFEADDPNNNKTKVPTGWEISDVWPPVTFGFTSPGSPYNGGTYAFLARMEVSTAKSKQPGQSFTLSQKLKTCPGQTYEVSFEYRYDEVADGLCFFSGSVGGYDFKTVFASVSNYKLDNKPGNWRRVKRNYTSTTLVDRLAFTARCDGSVSNAYSIDNVDVKPVGELLPGYQP